VLLGQLSEDERTRYVQLMHQDRKVEFLVTRSLFREALFTSFGLRKSQFKLGRSSTGKPLLIEPFNTPIRFNFSHAAGWAACALSLGAEIGFDIEDYTRKIDLDLLSQHYLSREEKSDVMSLPQQERQKRFFVYWTLKESYLKAVGVGLHSDLSQISFKYDDQAEIAVLNCAPLNEERTWYFRVLEPQRNVIAAVAISQPHLLNSLQINCAQFRPGQIQG